MPSNRQFDQVSANAQIALTEFATEFEQSLQSTPEGWGEMLGLVRQTSALRTRYPISISAAGYKRMTGNRVYRQLGSKHIELIHEKWQDGVSELADVVEAPEFFGWGDEPTNMAAALAALPNALLSTLLAAGESANAWDGVSFFHANGSNDGHPVNVLDTSAGRYKNLHVSMAPSVATLKSLKEFFRTIKSPIKQDGKQHSLGLRLTHLLVPPELEQPWLDIIENERIVIEVAGSDTDAVATDNRHRNTVKVVVGDELSEANYYYPLALNKPMKPWVTLKGSREELILGRDSAMFEESGKIGYSSEQNIMVGLAHPACIKRCKITA